MGKAHQQGPWRGSRALDGCWGEKLGLGGYSQPQDKAPAKTGKHKPIFCNLALARNYIGNRNNQPHLVVNEEPLKNEEH